MLHERCAREAYSGKVPPFSRGKTAELADTNAHVRGIQSIIIVLKHYARPFEEGLNLRDDTHPTIRVVHNPIGRLDFPMFDSGRDLGSFEHG